MRYLLPALFLVACTAPNPSSPCGGVGDPCCRDTNGRAFCSAGMACNGAEVCEAPADLGPPDMARAPGTLGAACRGDFDCKLDAKGRDVTCKTFTDGPQPTACCIRCPSGGDCWICR